MEKKNSSVIGWLICLIGATFYWYEYLLRIEPSIAVTEVMGKLQLTATGFGLITALYYYIYTPMQLAVGVLFDRFGTRRILSISIFCCTLGSFLFSLAPSIVLAGTARILIGFGSAFAFVGVLKLGAEWLPKSHFAFLAGLTTSLGMLAGMMGDILLTSLMGKIGWIQVQYVGTLVGLVLMPLIFFFIRDTPSSKTIRFEVTFRQTFQGLKEIIKSPQMWISGLIANALYLSLSAFAELWGIKFLQSVYSLPQEKASIACSLVFFGWLIGSPFNGWLSDHLSSRKRPLAIGGLLSFLTISLIILKPLPLSFLVLCSLLFLFGFFCSTEILCFALSKELNPHHLSATSVAFTNFLVMIGGVIFQPLLGLLLDLGWKGQLQNSLRVYSAGTYQLVFLIIPLTILIGTFLTFKLKETLKENN